MLKGFNLVTIANFASLVVTPFCQHKSLCEPVSMPLCGDDFHVLNLANLFGPFSCKKNPPGLEMTLAHFFWLQ